ncbi:MAG: Phosphoenolpyruvate synthase, partial [Parcubacteria group bacterium GW2011_GWA2_38_13]
IPKEKGEKQVLSDKQILELAELILKIENHYGFPVDVEWTREKGKFYIVQSRPITTLINSGKGEKIKEETKYVLGNQDVDTSFITIEMTWSGMGIDTKNKIGEDPLDSFVEIINGKTINYFVESDRIKQFAHSCAKAISENKKLLNRLRNETINVAKEMRGVAIKNLHSIDNLGDKEIIILLKKIKTLQAECASLGTAVAFADIFGEITNRLVGILKKRRNLSYSLNIYTNILGSPDEKSLTEKAYKEIRKSKEKDEILLNKFFWVDQGYIGRGLTLQQLDEIKKYKKDDEKYPLKEKLLKELELTDEESWMFEVSRNLIEIKSLRADLRQLAYPGKVGGIVKLIFGPQHNNKIKDGEILISRATSPQFLPAMKKAAAFITDVGGDNITRRHSCSGNEKAMHCGNGICHAGFKRRRYGRGGRGQWYC